MPYGPMPRYRLYTSWSYYLRAALETLTGSSTRGDSVERFEQAIAGRFGIGHAVAMPQARMGIYHVVKALIKPGQDVVLSPYTIADAINMVVCAGGRPVFADLQEGTCNVDPEALAKAITPNTGAVMVTHLHGLACEMDEILALCKEKGLPLIEDAAQAFGTLYKGKPVGTLGDAGILSYGMYKYLTSFFGGMVITPHTDLATTLREETASFPYTSKSVLLRKMISGMMTDVACHPWLFKPLTYWIFRFGYLHDIHAINKFVTVELDLRLKESLPESYYRRMSPLQARMALHGLPHVDTGIRKRIEYAMMYADGFQGIDGLQLPPRRDDGSHTYTYYPVMYENRKELLDWVMEHKRDMAVQHLKNCADLPAFKEYASDCPVARKTANSVLLVPTYPRYTPEEVRQNMDVIRSFFER